MIIFFKMLRIKDSGKAPEQNDIKDETWSMNTVQQAEEENLEAQGRGKVKALDAERQLESGCEGQRATWWEQETRSKWLFRPVKGFRLCAGANE